MPKSRYDYIVVGAGTAGCLIASRLSELAERVLLIESGPDRARTPSAERPAEYLRLQGTEVDWAYKTQPIKGLAGRKLDCPRGRTVGGSSAINAMIYHEGVPEDFAAWHERLGKLWSPESVDDGFSQLRRQCEDRFAIESPSELSVSCAAYMKAATSACSNATISGTPEVYQRTTRQGVRCSAASLLTERTSIASGLHVKRLEIKGDRVTGVVVAGRSDETITAEKAVVLTAGAIGSPQLLMLSGIGPREELRSVGIDTKIDSSEVGKNLVDHLAFPVIFATRNEPPFPSNWTLRELAQWHYLGRGPIASNLAEAGGFFDLSVDPNRPENQTRRAIQLHVTPTHYLRYPSGDSPAAMTLAVTVSQPDSRGSISLISPSAFDAPRIDPNYFSVRSDLDRMIEGVQIARQIAQHEPLAQHIECELLPSVKRSTAEQIARTITRYAMTLYHPVGTCRMGTDAASVVDQDYRVRGLEGLFLADASVFPSIPRANPNATTMLVAHRAVARIAHQMSN